MKGNLIVPPGLRPGDTVAVCSPASAVDPALFAPAVRRLEEQGWNVRMMPHAMGCEGSYSALLRYRLADFTDALLDPEIKAIICGRGGYGTVHLLDALDRLPLRQNAKWVVGFSDISALHALMHRHGIASAHASMIRALNYESPENNALFSILRGEKPRAIDFSAHSHAANRPGEAEGVLVGGNLSVLCGLMGTPFDMFARDEDMLLFIEDINEPIYKVDRMLWQMRLAGVFQRVAGLIVGEFTGSAPDKNYGHVYEMIAEVARPYAFPVAYGAPIGHIKHNTPIIESVPARLSVTPTTAHLTF